MCRVLFAKSCCEHCPNRDVCRAKTQRKKFAVDVSSKMVARACYRKKLSTDEYRKLTRMRNAIDGIPSVLRRRYHIDQMPVRGIRLIRMFFICKICAYNFNKLRRYIKLQEEKSALMAANV